MKRSTKKGFTLVELLVVIAILAILGAVGVVGYTSFTKKAKISADEQAVTQMNIVLQANEVLEGKSISEAVQALKDAGLSGDDYVPLLKDRYFFWDQNDNRIIYAEYKSNDYVAVYPAEYEGKTYASLNHQWFSLNNKVKSEKVEYTYSESGNTVEVSSGEKLAGLFDTLKEAINKTAPASNSSSETIVDGVKVKGMNLSSGNFNGLTGKIVIDLKQDIDLMGASFNLNLCNADFTLNGNNHTIKGISNTSGFAVSSANSTGESSEYGGAFIGYAKKSIISFNNVKFENCSFGNDSVKGSAIFIGQASSCSQITFNKTEAKDITINGKRGVAAYVGHFLGEINGGNSTMTFTNTNKLENINLTSKEKSQVGIIAGRTTCNLGSSLDITSTSNITVTNINESAAGNKYSQNTWIVKGNNTSAEQITTQSDFSIIR